MNFSVEYTVTLKEQNGVKNLQLTGTVIDVCAGGVGLLTEFPLVQGNLLQLRSSVPEIPRYGVVRWVNREGDSYRAGLRTCKAVRTDYS